MGKKFESAEEMLKKASGAAENEVADKILNSIMTEMSSLTDKSELQCHMFSSSKGHGCYLEDLDNLFSKENNKIVFSNIGRDVNRKLYEYGFHIADIEEVANANYKFNIRMLKNSSDDDGKAPQRHQKSESYNLEDKNEDTKKYTKKKSVWYALLGIVLVCFFCYYLFGGNSEDTNKGNQNQGAEIENIEKATISKYSPQGKLYEMFKMPSEYTDLQRQNILKEVKGKYVVWTLPVYEIHERENNKFDISTSLDSERKIVGCDIVLIARNEQDKNILGSLKTGDLITIKGKLTGDASMRDLEIKPAILFYDK